MFWNIALAEPIIILDNEIRCQLEFKRIFTPARELVRMLARKSGRKFLQGRDCLSGAEVAIAKKSETAAALAFVPPLRVFLPARFRLHAQRDECYVHVMTRKPASKVLISAGDLSRRESACQRVSKTVSREWESCWQEGRETGVVTQRPFVPPRPNSNWRAEILGNSRGIVPMCTWFNDYD